MQSPNISHEPDVDELSDAQKSTGRQDLISPPATAEQSDPTPVDMRRGERVWLGFALLGVIFLAIILYFVVR